MLDNVEKMAELLLLRAEVLVMLRKNIDLYLQTGEMSFKEKAQYWGQESLKLKDKIAKLENS